MQQVLSNKKAILWEVLVGVMLGVLCYSMPLKYFLAAAAGVIVIIAILWRVEIGIFLTVGLIPVLPTTAVLGLVGITLISYLIRMCFDKSVRIRFTTIDLFVTSFAFVLFFAA